jgi:hypothetical protein
MSKILKRIQTYIPEEIPSFLSPERTLFAAVLERAVRDLHPRISSYDRANARNWFLDYALNADTPVPPGKVTFKMCIEALDLGGIEIKRLLSKAYETLSEETSISWN